MRQEQGTEEDGDRECYEGQWLRSVGMLLGATAAAFSEPFGGRLAYSLGDSHANEYNRGLPMTV